MDDWNKFDECVLPSKEEFYSNLDMSNISDKHYEHAKKVSNTLNIKNFGQYHDLYVQSDTMLLADVFENFRKVCLKEYQLDPCYFVSAPEVAWTAVLRLTNVKLELLTDVDMLLMFEEGIRVIVSEAIHKYGTTNNKYMKSYNKSVISSYLQYLDANNLYGWSMFKKRPIGEFKWINPNNYSSDNIKNYDDNSNTGAILKVDVEYLEDLHNLHRDLAFLCDRKMLDKTTKLVATLEDKKEYVVHISALKQAFNNKLILKKMHKVIEFKQRAWMKPYIDKNTKLRSESKNDLTFKKTSLN